MNDPVPIEEVKTVSFICLRCFRSVGTNVNDLAEADHAKLCEPITMADQASARLDRKHGFFA